MLKKYQDAFGRGMVDYLNGNAESEIVERDDGYVYASGGPGAYFSEYQTWPEKDREALRFASGRVLDIGCGAGRHALYLQKHGMDVVAIDNSPLAIEVCQQRGVRDARVMTISQFGSELGTFDTILLLGNNIGLLENERKARVILKRFFRTTSPKARIIGSTKDPHQAQDQEHVLYRERNLRKERMPGQERFRVRYKTIATPWFDYLRLSKEELEDILDNTGWKIEQYFSSANSPFYSVLLSKSSI